MSSWMEFAEYADMFTRWDTPYCNEYCLSFDGSKCCVATGFWLIITSSDIAVAPKSGLPNGKGSVLTVLDTMKTTEKSFKSGQIFALLWVL